VLGAGTAGGTRRSGNRAVGGIARGTTESALTDADARADAPANRLIDVLLQVGGQDHDAVSLLHLLEEIGNPHVRIAVLRVLNFGALAEECIRPGEEEDRIAAWASLTIQLRFFSVSPIYLLTTAEWSTVKIGL
jgi:hypothetical protein